MTSPTPDEWAAARQAWEGGASYTVAARLAGVGRETLRKRSVKEGWSQDTPEARAAAEARRRTTEAARLEAERKWANRRAAEADAAGLTAAKARQAIVTSIDAADAHMVRATAIAYGVLIDKARLLSNDTGSGAATKGLLERLVEGLEEG